MASEQSGSRTASPSPRKIGRSPARPGGWLGAGLVGAGVSAWQGTLSRYASRAHWSTGAIVGLVLVGALVAGRGRQRASTRAWSGAVVLAVRQWRRRPPAMVAGVVGWTALIVLAIGWDLDSFAHQSPDLPTLSRLLGDVTAAPAGRGLLFAGWLVLGAYLVVGGRRRR